MRVDLTMVLREYDQDQSKFVCFNPKENIPKNHLCFIINDVIENLDFSSVHEKYEGIAGNPAYNRKIFIKIDLMGLMDGIFSSRKICEQTYYNDMYKFLA
jgi:transposase